MLEFFSQQYLVYEYFIFAIGINILMGLSMYITLSAGTFSLAQGALMAIGAYTSAILTKSLGTPFPLSIAGGMLSSLIVAIIIVKPVLRLSGFYLAIGTIALGESIRYTALNLKITGGALGLKAIPPKAEMWHLLIALGVCIYFFVMMEGSRIGRAFTAIKEDEVGSSTMGINTAHYRLLAFLSSALIAALAGALEAHHSYFISCGQYGFGLIIAMLAYCVVGGTSSFWGPIGGAILLSILPEILRPIGDYRMLFDSTAILIIVLFMPDGILKVLPLWRKMITNIGSMKKN